MSLLAELQRRNVIRVAMAYVALAWLVVQVLDTLAPLFGISEATAKLIVILLAIGLVPTLIISWLFELTPAGFRREGREDGGAIHTRESTRKLDRMIIGILAIAVTFFAFDKFVLDPARDTEIAEQAAEEARSDALLRANGENSIAVLPFVNMSSDAEQDYFAEGIADDLLSLLARAPELRVISRSSAFRFKGANLDAPNIAEQLRVRYVLEGSVRKSGGQVRVTAQLIDARSNTQIWSGIYDRQLVDIFAIQDEIASDVAQNVQGKLANNLPLLRRTVPEAYELTLRARYIDRTGIAQADGLSTLDMLERAVELDPNYQPALLALAVNIYFAMHRGAYPPDLAIPRIEELLGRAAAIDPQDPVLLGYLAWLSFEGQNDLEAAAAQFDAAIHSAPGDTELLSTAGAFASVIGKHNIAVDLSKRATELDPLCFVCLYDLARTYEDAGRYDEALETQKLYMQLGEGGGGTLGMLHLYRGEPESALASFDGERTNDFQVNAGRAMALKDLGRDAESADALAQQIRLFGEEYPLETARAYAWTGDTDAAFEWLDKAISATPFEFVTLSHDPIWQKIRDDSRWREWQEKAGVTEERLKAIEFAPQLPDSRFH